VVEFWLYREEEKDLLHLDKVGGMALPLLSKQYLRSFVVKNLRQKNDSVKNDSVRNLVPVPLL